MESYEFDMVIRNIYNGKIDFKHNSSPYNLTIDFSCVGDFGYCTFDLYKNNVLVRTGIYISYPQRFFYLWRGVFFSVIYSRYKSKKDDIPTLYFDLGRRITYDMKIPKLAYAKAKLIKLLRIS